MNDASNPGQAFPINDWYRLDNAAKIYPSTTTDRSPAMFRIAVSLTKPVKLSILQQALESVMPRFPYFQVYLKRGFFWYYLQKHSEIPKIQLLDLSRVPNIPVHSRSTHLLRVCTRQNVVAVDFSHIITDGNGGVRFVSTLVAEYLKLCGVSVAPHENILNLNEQPGFEEDEDAYRKYFTKGIPGPESISPAYHEPGRPVSSDRFRTITGRIPVQQILGLARGKGVTLTEYLAALMMFCLTQIYQDETGSGVKSRRSIIRLEVPVNMRLFYPSKTMRNFSLFVSPEVDLKLGAFSFDEMLKRVHHTLQLQIDAKELNKQLSRNVAAELHPAVRFLPLHIKDCLLGWVHAKMGEQLFSGVLSNLGRITFPDDMNSAIESVNVVLNPNQVMKKSCSVVTYQNDLYITFCSLIESRKLEKLFFTRLVENGVSIHVKEY